jgi:hypothetical protein
MNRKTQSHEPAEDAREVGGSPPGAQAWRDPAQTLAAGMAVHTQVSTWMQDVQRAHLDAWMALESAFATAAATSLRSPGSDAAQAAWDGFGQAWVRCVREDQDRCIQAGNTLQGELLRSLRERADALREAWRPAATQSAALPFDPADVLSQARQSLDTWMAQWTAMFVPHPVAIA